MSLLQNNENDVPMGSSSSFQYRPGKFTSKSFRGNSDHKGKAEKRPRGLKPMGGRRAVLGDVTNKISIKKSSTMNMGMYSAQNKKKPMSKRSMTSNKVESVATTPVDIRRLSTLEEEDEEASGSPLQTTDHDIDSEDQQDANACWQYAGDVTKYHLETEKERMPNPSYMSRQADVNSKMRAILIDWLVDVHCKYDLLPQTLYIAIYLIDRHLEKDLSVPRQRLQLVGVTALFIAAKYEEIYPPEAEDFVRITDNAYTKDELFAMEVRILNRIGFRVTFPTAHQFMDRFLKASRTRDERVQHFAHYVLDRSLQEYKLIKYRPSMVAASAVHIARTQMKDQPAWNPTLQHHSTYAESDLTDCIEDLKEMLWNAQNGVGKSSKLTAVKRKFEKERFMGVAKHPLVLDDAL